MKYSKDILAILEIFWNAKNKSVRSKLTDFLAAYIETGDIDDPKFNYTMSFFSIQMESLRNKNLVKSEIINNTIVWSLTTEGQLVLHRKHPRLKILLQNFIESTPAMVVIISALIGFLASIAGIIQFYDWLF